MKKLLLALTLLLLPSAAFAQCNGIFANGTVCGNTSGQPGLPYQVPSTSLPGLNLQVGTTAITGGTNGPLINQGGILQNPSTLSNTYIAPGTANTMKGSLNGTSTSDIALVACTAAYQLTQWITGTGWQCGINPLLPSRATAATLNLSAFQAVQTLGYSSPGDGGGATFIKQSSGTPFMDQSIDTQVTPPTIVGGSGYTDGTYNGVLLTGGSAPNADCEGQVVVSGGVVTQVNIAIPCPMYKIGDVLTAPNSEIGTTGSGFTWTVNAINSAQGSFIDSGNNSWQIVADQGGRSNVLQYGAQGNWNGSDAGVTNSRPAFWSAIAQAMVPHGATAALINGDTIYVPKGAYLICGGTQGATLAIPQGVALRGAGRWGGTSIVQCAAESSNNHGIWLCDPFSKNGQFGCLAEDLVLNTSQASATNSIAAFAAYSGQQFELLKNVGILAGNRECLLFNFGSGGAATAIFNGAECVQAQGATNPAVQIGSNTSGTLVIIRDWVTESAGTGESAEAYVLQGAPYVVLQGDHIEGHTGNGINIATTGGSVSIRDMSISGPCTSAITLQSTNPNNTVLTENIQSGCTTTVINGHSGGSNVTGSILAQKVYNP